VANVEQSTGTLRIIRLFFGPIPMVVILLALPLLIWYPITRESHAALRAKLDSIEENGAQPFTAPADNEPD
jgi:Na+/melibiose symporter-like transporter